MDSVIIFQSAVFLCALDAPRGIVMYMSVFGVLRTPPVVIRMKPSHGLLQRKSNALGPLPLGSLQLLCRNYGYSHSLLWTLCPVELHELHVAVQSSCSA